MNNFLTHILGWLLAYLYGYLHRDISIGNLQKLLTPAFRQVFSALEGHKRLLHLQGALGDQEGLHFADSTVEDPTHQELRRLAEGLDDAVGQCGVTTECRAIFIDGDMAAYIPDYFQKTTVHGTGHISVSTAICLCYQS
jgi:hypothetical protein